MSSRRSASSASNAASTSAELIQEAATAAVAVAKNWAAKERLSVADAEDAVAQAFEQFCQALRRGEEIRSPQAWIRHTAQRRYVDEVRRRSRSTLVDDLQSMNETETDYRLSPEAVVEVEDSTARVLGLIALLPQAQCEVMRLVVIDRLKPAEIAQKLETTAATVSNRLYAARTTLREKIGVEGIAKALDMEATEVHARRRDQNTKTTIQEGGGP